MRRLRLRLQQHLGLAAEAETAGEKGASLLLGPHGHPNLDLQLLPLLPLTLFLHHFWSGSLYWQSVHLRDHGSTQVEVLQRLVGLHLAAAERDEKELAFVLVGQPLTAATAAPPHNGLLGSVALAQPHPSEGHSHSLSLLRLAVVVGFQHAALHRFGAKDVYLEVGLGRAGFQLILGAAARGAAALVAAALAVALATLLACAAAVAVAVAAAAAAAAAVVVVVAAAAVAAAAAGKQLWRLLLPRKPSSS